ncbi:sigma-70 family RNA polymerase sigma factor [Aquirufa sp. KTFRIE-69F]|jgi:RNA polymerase sigma factor (sigma-70 family)|uniref:Sigma-70 family RNA polymerase sigma factor n=1 Tax=Aquirufa originis TaxID=3096514 RepID=A0ABW6D3Q8_9BACT
MKKSINEVEVWDQFRGGDQQAFALLYSHFVQPLYTYCMGITSDKDLIKDCLHDLFVEIWKNHASLGPTTSVKFYLMASIKRKIVRQLESQLKNLNHHEAYKYQFMEDTPSPERQLVMVEEERMSYTLMYQSLNRLSKRQREAISLKYFENMDTDQISEKMNINTQSVYNLIFGALRVMKEQMSMRAFAC